jgi:protein subunit release factor A
VGEDAVVVEVRAGEGGMDAKLLVRDQVKVYEKFAGRRGL